MLPNEIFALACRAYYEEQGLIVDKRNGEFAHCPYPRGMGDTGYYLLWEHHQQQGLLQSRDVGRCCFLIGSAKKWLTTCNYWPDNYFELWDIYEEFTNSHLKEASAKAHKEKDDQGRSLLTLKLLANVHNEKTEDGKSKHAVSSGRAGGKKCHEDKNEEGKSKHGIKVGKKVHEKKDELGRSLHNLELHRVKNPEGKRAKRRASFCSRMKGMKSKLTSAETARDPDSRINKALRRWNCN